MPLELESLVKALSALKRAIHAANESSSSLTAEVRETLKAGVVQNFEVAYEQCWKFIQRWIRENRTPEDADHPRSRKELFRLAARYGLISDPLPWFGFGDARNLTSHTYDPAQAAASFEAAKSFLPHAEDLLKRLESKND